MDEIALIRACLANPEDNTCRLILADWWDEFGDERQRARAEWVRLICAGGRLRKGVSWQRGEKDWVVKNAVRLWPTMSARSNVRVTGTQRSPDMKFSKGTIRLNVPFLKGHPPTPIISVVELALSRGVTGMIQVPSNRLAVLGPLIARDEPHADLYFVSASMIDVIADRWTGMGCNIVVSERLFYRRGLIDVWEKLKVYNGDLRISDDGTKSWVYKYRHSQDFSTSHQVRRVSEDRHKISVVARRQVVGYINSAYTAWARECAAQSAPK